MRPIKRTHVAMLGIAVGWLACFAIAYKTTVAPVPLGGHTLACEVDGAATTTIVGIKRIRVTPDGVYILRFLDRATHARYRMGPRELCFVEAKE